MQRLSLLSTYKTNVGILYHNIGATSLHHQQKIHLLKRLLSYSFIFDHNRVGEGEAWWMLNSFPASTKSRVWYGFNGVQSLHPNKRVDGILKKTLNIGITEYVFQICPKTQGFNPYNGYRGAEPD